MFLFCRIYFIEYQFFVVVIFRDKYVFNVMVIEVIRVVLKNIKDGGNINEQF